MRLPPELLRLTPCPQPHELRFDLLPIQVGLCRSAWHVTIASIIHTTVRPRIVQSLFNLCPNPLMLALADVIDLQVLLGFHRTRCRHLQRLSWRWDTSGWSDLRDLPSISKRVADAVQVYCFGPLMSTPSTVDGVEYKTIKDAYDALQTLWLKM